MNTFIGIFENPEKAPVKYSHAKEQILGGFGMVSRAGEGRTEKSTKNYVVYRYIGARRFPARMEHFYRYF